MEKIVFLSDENSPRIRQLYEILLKDYEILLVHDKNGIMSLLDQSFDDLSVLIVDNPSSKNYIDDLLN